MEDADAELVEFGAAIRGTVDKLQTVDMSFDRSVTPGLFGSYKESSLVAALVFGKVGEWDAALASRQAASPECR